MCPVEARKESKEMRERLKTKINDAAFVWQFAIDDFKGKYAGSALGVAWAFLQPIITIVLYWFIFQLGFKSAPVENFPFILWLMIGLVPWFFVSEAIANATASMVEYSYLVKKVLFNINILPFAKVLSVLLVQFVLIIFAIVLYAIFGYYPDVYYLQIPIYLIYMLIVVSGIAYLTATLYVFFRDVVQIVSIVIQIVFWLTPIVWDFQIMPEMVRKILVFNPFYYVVIGYRNIFIYKDGMGQGLGMTIYYWAIALVLLVAGLRLFHKCKDHFADVL